MKKVWTILGVLLLVAAASALTYAVTVTERPGEEELTLELSDLLDRDLERPRVSQLEGKVVLTFSEKAELTAVFGSYQITCGGENLCGDSFRTFVTDGVTAHLILSDGMGSGSRAARSG